MALRAPANRATGQTLLTFLASPRSDGRQLAPRRRRGPGHLFLEVAPQPRLPGRLADGTRQLAWRHLFRQAPPPVATEAIRRPAALFPPKPETADRTKIPPRFQPPVAGATSESRRQCQSSAISWWCPRSLLRRMPDVSSPTLNQAFSHDYLACRLEATLKREPNEGCLQETRPKRG